MEDQNKIFEASFFDIACIGNLEPGDTMISEDGSFSVIYYDPFYTFIVNSQEFSDNKDFKNVDLLLDYLEN